MQVILLERNRKLGQMGDVVSVRRGYARNFLLPQGKALVANEANRATFMARRAQLEARNLETRKEAEDLAERLAGRQFVVIRAASDSGALYGSVTTRDAADVASEGGFLLDRRQVALKRPIKEIGIHEVVVTLHPEIAVTIGLNIARSGDEAALQAAGTSIQEQRAVDEAAARQELVDQLGGLEEDKTNDEPGMSGDIHP